MDGGADVVVSLPANMYLVNASASLQNARGLGIYSLDGQFVVFGDVFMKYSKDEYKARRRES